MYFFGKVAVLSGFRVPVLLVSEDRVVGGDALNWKLVLLWCQQLMMIF
jgi:hypothetical protein